MKDTDLPDQEKLFKAVVRLNAKVFGIVLGILFGLVIFIATIWLVIKGPEMTSSGEYVVGPHLQLLSQFFIGYEVSFLGSIIGFVYGFAVGTFSGALLSRIYNKIVDLRSWQIIYVAAYLASRISWFVPALGEIASSRETKQSKLENLAEISTRKHGKQLKQENVS